MSTRKDDAGKRGTTTTTAKERNVVPKPSTRKSTKNDNVQKKLTGEEEKPVRKTNVIRKETKERKDKATPKNVTVPSKSIPSSSKPLIKSITNKTSSRIKTTQYFPSKNLYSNALKSVDSQSKIPENQFSSPKKQGAVKNQKTEKSTSNVKKSSDIPIRETSPERPRTATLRKGSIVNDNIVGPEAPAITPSVLQSNEKSPSAQSSSEDNYDDDFESYESDFEAATSSEDTNLAAITSVGTDFASSDTDSDEKPSPSQETKRIIIPSPTAVATESEKKLDSGTFELSDFKHRQIIKHIEDAIQEQAKCSNHQSLSDEGFEDQRSMMHFINFADAKKKCEKKEASAARKKRGQELLGMIKLDAVSFTIFDCPAVPYDVFIANYGKGNSVQASTQTGDDDVSEEVQTDDINTSSKWCQMPNKFSTFDINERRFWVNYKLEYNGAGTGDDDGNDDNDDGEEGDSGRLDNFMKHSGELMLRVLFEEKLNRIGELTKSPKESLMMPFSGGYLQFNTAGDVLRNTSVLNISVNSKNISKVLTVHLKNSVDYNVAKSVICIWDLDDLNSPRTTLFSFGTVNCSAFASDADGGVFAGQKDGAVLFWDIDGNNGQYDVGSGTPSFVTPISSGHLSEVVAIHSLPHESQGHGDVLEVAESSEICTLDETGMIIIWTLYSEADGQSKVLIKTHVIRLPDIYPQFSDLVCTDCIVMENQIYVSTNYGFILHYFIRRSSKNGIKMFAPETKIASTYLEPCPFLPSYFLAGFSNGAISLYSRTTERPLLVMQNKEQIDGAGGIEIIQWSKTKPFLFYVTDSKNVIHIWDLCKSDLYPEYSIPFSGKISTMKLSPVLNPEKEEAPYMLIGTEDGEIYLHLLRKEYGQAKFEDYQKDVRIFSNYVYRL